MTTKIGPSGLQESYLQSHVTRLYGVSFSTGAVLHNSLELLTNGTSYYFWPGEFPTGGLVVAPGTDPELSGFSLANLSGVTYNQIRAYAGDASLLYCVGKSHIFDDAAGPFVFDQEDTDGLDNGITILVDSTGRRWKRVFDGVACVEWAEGSSDRLMIKKALAAKIPLQMKAGSDYIWDGTDSMEIDVGYTSLHGNSSRIVFSGFEDVSTESAIKFISTLPHSPGDYWVAQNTTKPVSDLVIIGPKSAGGGSAYDSECVGLDITMPHLNLNGLFIYGFGHGLRVGAAGYCLSAAACNIGQCANGVTVISGASDYGESLEFFGCKIYNNGVGINNNCPTGVVRMIGGSLDYNLKQIIGTNSSTTELASTWFECNDAGTGKAHIYLSGGATFRMNGGHVQQNGPAGSLLQAGLVHTDSTSKAAFRNVHMFNTRNTANVLDSGFGLCIVDGTDSYTVSYLPSRLANVAGNLLSDGGFSTLSVSDMWFIYSDTATITDRLVGANVSISISPTYYQSVANSLKLSKVAGGAEGAIAICVPISSGSRAAFTGSYYKPAGASTGGNIFVTTIAARIEGVKSNGCPNILNSISFDTQAIGGTDSEIPWTAFGTGMDRIIPSWATHFLVLINASAFQGDLYFDDWNISTM